MCYSEFANSYFQFREDVYAKIKSFSERKARENKPNYFAKLLTDQSDINFFSWLSEMKFGLKLDQTFKYLEYEPKGKNTKPDWQVIANNQTILFEVVRINRNQEDMLYKIAEFAMKKSDGANSVLTIKHSGTLYGEYLYGNLAKIEKKEVAYKEIVQKNNSPFIICVDTSDIELFTFYNDFHDFFIGNGTNGYFNRNLSFGKNVTALFVQDPFEYKLIVNESSANKLNLSNLDALKQICD